LDLIAVQFTYLWSFLGVRATERGYKLLIGATEQNPDLEKRTLDQLHQYQVDGLIFVDSWGDPSVYLNDDSLPPMVFAQLRSPMIEHNCIGVDNVRGGYEATRHLLDLGYRKVAHISGPEGWASAVDRRLGYQQALEDYDLVCDPSLVEVGDWEVRSGNKAARLLLDRHPEIDAIFVGNDLMAAGCIQAAVSRGLRVPQDLALVGYDDRYLAEALSPPLSSFAYPLNQMGQKATHLLIERLLRRKASLVPSINVAGRMVVRASCGATSS
jgi:LacI family transcriptional regulator